MEEVRFGGGEFALTQQCFGQEYTGGGIIGVGGNGLPQMCASLIGLVEMLERPQPLQAAWWRSREWAAREARHSWRASSGRSRS